MMNFADFKQFVTALFTAENDSLTNYMSEVEADNFLLSAWVAEENPADVWWDFVEREDVQSLRAR